jgi:hypothetical protein
MERRFGLPLRDVNEKTPVAENNTGEKRRLSRLKIGAPFADDWGQLEACRPRVIVV